MASPICALGQRASKGAGSGRQWHIENGLIEVDGHIFSSGGGAEGNIRLEFFFGFVNRGRPDSMNVGLFVYSDEPFEGAIEAGAFEGQEARFSIAGHDVVVASRDPNGTPLLGDGSRTPLYALHRPDFFWTTASGKILYNVIGSAHDIEFILSHDQLKWAFNMELGEIVLDGNTLMGGPRGGGGVSQDPFDWYFVYAGLERGGLFVISDRAFGDASEAGAFEGQELRFEINGHEMIVKTLAPSLLRDGTRTPAWVLHRPDFVWNGPSGSATNPTRRQ